MRHHAALTCISWQGHNRPCTARPVLDNDQAPAPLHSIHCLWHAAESCTCHAPAAAAAAVVLVAVALVADPRMHISRIVLHDYHLVLSMLGSYSTKCTRQQASLVASISSVISLLSIVCFQHGHAADSYTSELLNAHVPPLSQVKPRYNPLDVLGIWALSPLCPSYQLPCPYLCCVLVDLRDVVELRHFVSNKLGISERQVAMMTWAEVLHRIVLVQRTTRLCVAR